MGASNASLLLVLSAPCLHAWLSVYVRASQLVDWQFRFAVCQLRHCINKDTFRRASSHQDPNCNVLRVGAHWFTPHVTRPVSAQAHTTTRKLPVCKQIRLGQQARMGKLLACRACPTCTCTLGTRHCPSMGDGPISSIEHEARQLSHVSSCPIVNWQTTTR